MRRRIILTTMATAGVLLNGCISDPLIPSTFSNDNYKQKALIFKTNTTTFISELKNRNSYMDEFILKSDMQCQNYLNTPQAQTNTEIENSNLYMSIFDTISTLFGMKVVTDTAKIMVSGVENKIENQNSYKQALSPEIFRGVEINRERYAKKMKEKQALSEKEYSLKAFQKDMLTYDKQCAEEYGLIEINRALKAMQHNIQQPAVASTKAPISIEAVKNSVKTVTEEVKAKKETKKKKETEKKQEIEKTEVKNDTNQTK